MPNETPLHITFLIHTLESGGAEGQLVEWLRALRADPLFRCRVICLVSGGFHEQAVRALGVQVDILGYRPMRDKVTGRVNLANAASAMRAWFRLVSLLRRDPPHVLQTVLLMSDLFGRLAHPLIPRRSGAGGTCRLVGSRRALSDCARLGGLRGRVVRWTVRGADVLFCNSRAVARDVVRLQGADPRRIACMYNGVDVERFEAARPRRESTRTALECPPNALAIGCVAQLRPEKGHAVLLEAFARHRIKHPDSHLYLVGGGPLEPLLRERALAPDIQSHVHFLGIRKDIPELLSAFDLVVQPSDTEGFSNVVLEAMAAELPVVATHVGGNLEALEEGRVGVLVPPRDASALAGALDRLADSPDERRRLGEAARRRARETFSIDNLHRSVRQFYRDVATGTWQPDTTWTVDPAMPKESSSNRADSD